jgi:hypothetical protein
MARIQQPQTLDKPAVGAKFQRSGLVLIAAFEAKSEKCQLRTVKFGQQQWNSRVSI